MFGLLNDRGALKFACGFPFLNVSNTDFAIQNELLPNE